MFRFHLKQSSIPIITLIFVLSWTPDAQAYLDPTSGGMVLQLLVASVFGVIFILKAYWGKFKNFIKKLVGKNSTGDCRN